MNPEAANIIREFTEKVNLLMRKRRPEEEPLDPFFSTRIPVTDLAVYSEPSEAFTSIEEDFFRSPLNEDERKIAIYSCSRTSSMNYSPPPLNDSAPVSVKKVDSVLYGKKLALAQATRPIEYFFHRRIQDSPGIGTADDHETYLASTMRALLSDIAAKITQARLDNLQKGINLPGKPIQLVSSDSKPLVDQEELDTLISKKPAVKRQRVQPFRKRQQNTFQRDVYSSKTVIAPKKKNAVATAEPTAHVRPTDRASNFQGRGRGRGRGYVQTGMVQTGGQTVGLKHSEEGIKNPIQEPRDSEVETVIDTEES
ncbi:hypothetical protein AYI68_g1005 [Smittium mucronatum]|uniref:Uncharacterized protein n=1 Tax=Smittium mucronatum TaxID=133383 RepID=A0A1R0H6T0_9FUNG|nr:hypothetical protein AYI68_g1005 [Smittium mucronatum]